MRFIEMRNVALLSALIAVPLILAAGFLSEPESSELAEVASATTMQQ